jgi:hypothetical protein
MIRSQLLSGKTEENRRKRQSCRSQNEIPPNKTRTIALRYSNTVSCVKIWEKFIFTCQFWKCANFYEIRNAKCSSQSIVEHWTPAVWIHWCQQGVEGDEGNSHTSLNLFLNQT